jgi:hypothetical protein
MSKRISFVLVAFVLFASLARASDPTLWGTVTAVDSGALQLRLDGGETLLSASRRIRSIGSGSWRSHGPRTLTPPREPSVSAAGSGSTSPKVVTERPALCGLSSGERASAAEETYGRP